MPTLNPVIIDAPPVNPSPTGLFAATTWVPLDGPPRFLADGIEIRNQNFDGLNASGVWEADWCASPDDLTNDDIKEGFRSPALEKFDPLVAWAFDECGLTQPSQTEVKARATQTLRLVEQQLVERAFATRLLADAGTPAAADDIVDAVSQLEAEFAKAGMLGVIHASAALAAFAVSKGVAKAQGSAYRSPLGHLFVFGGGYVEGLGNRIIGTSPVMGQRETDSSLRTALDTSHNRFIAIAERAYVVGYEDIYKAITVG